MDMKAFRAAGLLLILGIPGIASAVEPSKPTIVLFNQNIQTFVAGFDLHPGGGIEAIGLTEVTQSNLPVANPDRARSRLKIRVRFKHPGNNSDAGTFRPWVDTKTYPNPYTQQATSYYCEENGNVYSVDPQQEGFPCDFEANIGIANSGQNRYLVVSLAMFAWYQNQEEGSVDIGQGAVTVYDPASGDEIWRKQWKTTTGDWELEDNLSAVGDYLNDDGNDEVRIVYSRGLPNNAAEMKYQYFDIASGNKIKEKVFTIGGP